MGLLNYSLTLVPNSNENVSNLNTLLDEVQASVNHITDPQIDGPIGWDKMAPLHGALALSGDQALLSFQADDDAGATTCQVTVLENGYYLAWMSAEIVNSGLPGNPNFGGLIQLEVAGVVEATCKAEGYTEDPACAPLMDFNVIAAAAGQVVSVVGTSLYYQSVVQAKRLAILQLA